MTSLLNNSLVGSHRDLLSTGFIRLIGKRFAQDSSTSIAEKIKTRVHSVITD